MMTSLVTSLVTLYLRDKGFAMTDQSFHKPS